MNQIKTLNQISLIDIVKKRIERYRISNPLEWEFCNWEIQEFGTHTIILTLQNISSRPLIRFVNYPEHLYIAFYQSEKDNYPFQYYIDKGTVDFKQVEETLRYNHIRDFKRMYKYCICDIFKILVANLIKMEIVSSELTFNMKGYNFD